MSATVFSKFYWSDWQADPCLRRTSLAGRGLWIEMLSIMATGPKPGYLTVAGNEELPPSDLARIIGATEQEVADLLAELERNHVFSRDRHGKIISRRIIRDAKRVRDGKKTGKMGGNPSLRKHTGNSSPLNGQAKGHDNAPPLPHGARPSTSSQKPEANSQSSTLPSFEELEAKLREAAGWQNEPHPNLMVIGPILELLKAGASLETDVLPVVRAKAPSVRKRIGWAYFVDPIADAMRARHAAGEKLNGVKPTGEKVDWRTFTENDYENAVFIAKRKDRWPEAYGPPDRIPKHLVDDELTAIIRRTAA